MRVSDLSVSDFRAAVGEVAWAKGRELVRAAHPDPRCLPSDGLIARVICALPEEAQTAIGVGKVAIELGARLGHGVIEAIAGAAPTEATYYVAHATHTRHGLGAHRFTGKVPMVRLQLPGSGQVNFETAFGVVYAGDHKLHNVTLVEDKYGSVFNFEVGAVYLTTPARYLGARFAAVATYEVHDTAERVRAWILEAGMATGEAMVLFCAPNGEAICRRSWYQPTPFSSPDHWYRGEAAFEQGPRILLVDVCTTEELKTKTPHIQIEVGYTKIESTPEELAVFPALLTAQAGLRVAAIAASRGTDNALFNMLAPFGQALSWERKP